MKMDPAHASDLVLINTDSTKFKYYDKKFKRLGADKGKDRYIKDVIDTGVGMTPSFLQLVNARLGKEWHDKALKLPKHSGEMKSRGVAVKNIDVIRGIFVQEKTPKRVAVSKEVFSNSPLLEKTSDKKIDFNKKEDVLEGENAIPPFTPIISSTPKEMKRLDPIKVMHTPVAKTVEILKEVQNIPEPQPPVEEGQPIPIKASPSVPRYDPDAHSTVSSISTGVSPSEFQNNPAQDQQASQASQDQQTTDNVPFATTSTEQVIKGKYHKYSLLFYFGSIENPDYDRELQSNVMNSGMSKQDIVMGSESVIKNYGSILFVYGRKSDTLEEFHELIQLQFCFIRNLMRGTRSAMAVMDVNDLTNFYGKLNGSSDPRNDYVGPQPPEENVVPEDSVSQAESAQPIQVQKPQSQSIQVQITENEAIHNVVKAYRNAPVDNFGKPVISKAAATIPLNVPRVSISEHHRKKKY